MANYVHTYSGEQIDEAVGKVRDINSTAGQIDAAAALAADSGDHVVQTVLATTTGDWSYIVYDSGACVLWGQVDVDLGTVTKTTWGSGIYTDTVTATLPFAVSGVVMGTAQNLCCFVNGYLDGASVGFRLTRAVDTTQSTPVRILIVGRT